MSRKHIRSGRNSFTCKLEVTFILMSLPEDKARNLKVSAPPFPKFNGDRSL